MIKYYISIATLLFTLESHADVASQSQIESDVSLRGMVYFCNKIVQFANEDEKMKWYIYEQDENNTNEAGYRINEYLEKKYSKADYEKILINGFDKFRQHLKYRHGLLKEMKNEKEKRAHKYKELEACRELWDDII